VVANEDAGVPAEDRERASRAASNRLLARVILVFVLLIAAYFAFASTELYKSLIFQPYLRVNIALSADILAMLGEAVHTDGLSLFSDNASVTIAQGCDGIEPMVLFLSALFAFPTRWLLRLPALLLFLPLLAALNLVRIVSLFLISAYRPELFVVMHTDVWQVVYIVFALVLFGFWLAWATRTRESAQH
jgi:exosortase/archaeosortase family protein